MRTEAIGPRWTSLLAHLLEPLVAHAASSASVAAASASPAASAAAKKSRSSASSRPMWVAGRPLSAYSSTGASRGQSSCRSPHASRSSSSAPSPRPTCGRSRLARRGRHPNVAEQQPQDRRRVVAQAAMARARVGARHPRREQGLEAEGERGVRGVERRHAAVAELAGRSPTIPGPGPAITASQPSGPAAACSAPITVSASISPAVGGPGGQVLAEQLGAPQLGDVLRERARAARRLRSGRSRPAGRGGRARPPRRPAPAARAARGRGRESAASTASGSRASTGSTGCWSEV